MPDAYSQLVALALLLAPPGTPEQPPDDYDSIHAAVVAKAIELELLDQRQVSATLYYTWQGDLDILRRRREDLADAPCLAYAHALPDVDAINRMCAFNREYKCHLERRLRWESDRADIIGALILETDRLYVIWDCARDCRSDVYWVPIRRASLARLRDLVGAEAFATGQWPGYVPEWGFREIR